MNSAGALEGAIGGATAAMRSLAPAASLDPEGMTPSSVARLLDTSAQLSTMADAVLAIAASEVALRSEDRSGLAQRRGFRTARAMIAAATGGSMAEADRLIQAGLMMTGRDSSPGQPTETPAPHPPQPGHDAGPQLEIEEGSGPDDDRHDSNAPNGGTDETHLPKDPPVKSPLTLVRDHMAALSAQGALSVDAVAVLRAAMQRVPDTDAAARVFAAAVEKAQGLASFQVRKLAWSAEAAADPQGWAERQREQRTRRYLLLRDEPDGMVKLDGRLDALTAAAIKQVVEAGITHAFNVRRDTRRRGSAGSPARHGNLSYPGAVEGEDVRERAQIAADVLADVFRHAAGCDELATGTTMSIVVRMDESDLRQGLGNGTIDNSDLPLPVRDLRAAAADAEVIPMVLNASSTALDLGRSRRLFTRAQKIALIERDGGCAWCNAPPVRCHAHHIKWWGRDEGESNLDNGIMLCTRCHHRIHDTGWEIRVRNGAVEFIPPASIDPDRTPVPGGRRRFAVRGRDVDEKDSEAAGRTLPTAGNAETSLVA